MKPNLVIYFLIFVSGCHITRGTTNPNYMILVNDLLHMQEGAGWPARLHVAEGNEALLRLNTHYHPTACHVVTPNGQEIDVQHPPSSKYSAWSEGCGLRLRRVEESDEGRWRLTGSDGQHNATGWVEVIVENKTSSYSAPEIALRDGVGTELELTSLNNSYCVVTQPFTESSLVPGRCRVTLEKATRAVRGNWQVVLGLPGQVSELLVERHVNVEAETLDVGYRHDSTHHKLHLYCNLLHSDKNVTFCRFQKTSSQTGFNLRDGLSDGEHSYYGAGFTQGQCGMTLENPTSAHYGTWRCSVGLTAHAGPAAPMQALISVAPDGRALRVIRDAQPAEEEEPVFVERDASFTVRCSASLALRYCWLQHPNGTQISPAPLVDEKQPFWYAGESLQVGDCAITFSHAREEDAGEWTCHMGPNDQLGIELTDRVTVRVTGSLAANRDNVATHIGGTATIYCHTANGNRPLDYCRFMTPNFVGLSVDSSVTKENAILGRMYFTPGRTVDHGQCSLTVDPVTAEDLGRWTCAALLNQETLEARDYITLYTDSPTGSRRVSRAGIIGMSLGVSLLALVLTGVMVYRRVPLPWRSTTASQAPLRMRMGSIRSTNSAGSAGTSISASSDLSNQTSVSA